jgi:tetratricopeptide (TPR) repeat protein
VARRSPIYDKGDAEHTQAKWMEAETEFKRAIELNPNYSIAHHYYAGHLMLMGRRAEAIAEAKRAIGLDPLSPIISTFLGRAYYYARDYDQAIAQYRRTFEIVPNFSVASSFLVQAYEQKGMYEAAIAEWRSASIGDGQSPELRGLSRSLAALIKPPVPGAIGRNGLA